MESHPWRLIAKKKSRILPTGDFWLEIYTVKLFGTSILGLFYFTSLYWLHLGRFHFQKKSTWAGWFTWALEGPKELVFFCCTPMKRKADLRENSAPNPKHIIIIPNFLGDGPVVIMFAAKVAIFATHVPALWGFVTFFKKFAKKNTPVWY